MTMISKAAVGIAVGIAGIFVGYCFYFDQKRRSDPDFKKKLKERRKAKKISQRPVCSGIPDLNDPETVRNFFLQQVQLGEECLDAGDTENGICHLAQAVAVCGQPTELLDVLQRTLPPHAYSLLLQRLPNVKQTLFLKKPTMAEEEVE